MITKEELREIDLLIKEKSKQELLNTNPELAEHFEKRRKKSERKLTELERKINEAKNSYNPRTRTNNCLCCGVEFKPRNRAQVFCCGICRDYTLAEGRLTREEVIQQRLTPCPKCKSIYDPDELKYHNRIKKRICKECFVKYPKLTKEERAKEIIEEKKIIAERREKALLSKKQYLENWDKIAKETRAKTEGFKKVMELAKTLTDEERVIIESLIPDGGGLDYPKFKKYYDEMKKIKGNSQILAAI